MDFSYRLNHKICYNLVHYIITVVIQLWYRTKLDLWIFIYYMFSFIYLIVFVQSFKKDREIQQQQTNNIVENKLLFRSFLFILREYNTENVGGAKSTNVCEDEWFCLPSYSYRCRVQPESRSSMGPCTEFRWREIEVVLNRHYWKKRAPFDKNNSTVLLFIFVAKIISTERQTQIIFQNWRAFIVRLLLDPFLKAKFNDLVRHLG